MLGSDTVPTAQTDVISGIRGLRLALQTTCNLKVAHKVGMCNPEVAYQHAETRKVDISQ